jgi:hypothetical protein
MNEIMKPHMSLAGLDEREKRAMQSYLARFVSSVEF